ncbi:MFS transporter [Thermicanus aegyptius]|uniref:MFS transporter n=1 Tax=Thermicanus aegyptius TaxID=94009 RepID=UPI0004027A96|nr:MFS transporter [Thermicanus aegyptius]
MYRYTPEEIALNMKYSIKNAMFSAAAGNIYAGFVALFAMEALRANEYQVALLSSLPQMMNLLAIIPGTLILNRLTKKREFTGYNIALGKIIYLFIALIPFLPFDQAWMLVIAAALLGLPNSFANLSWSSFIGDLIPAEKRNNFFGIRNKYATLASMITVLGVGLILNFFDKTNPYPYSFFFFLAFLLGLMESFYLFRHIEYPADAPVTPKGSPLKSPLRFIPAMIKNRPYLLFMICAILLNFGWQMAWPLFNIYQIKNAHATAMWFSFFTVANQLSQIFAYPYWSRFANKYGNSAMLFLSGLGLATAPTLTILSPNLFYLVLVNLWTGIPVAGVTMLLFNQLLHVSPENERTTYIAGYNIIIGLVGFIAPQVGVWLLELGDIYSSMNISSVFRLIGAFSFLGVFLLYERKELLQTHGEGASLLKHLGGRWAQLSLSFTKLHRRVWPKRRDK